MKVSVHKYLFTASSIILLFIMLFMSRDAGISCDEVLHYDHSVAVYNFFASHGKDQSCLDTPVSQLKYYGQSYDNVVTILAKWFHIENVYGFRHFMSPLAGWMAILMTALLAVWLSGYRTGLLVVLLFAVTPTFLGHSQNNLKDIPFALGYISSIYFIFKFISTDQGLSVKALLPLILCIAFSISIRAGGLILICYLFFFFFVYRFAENLRGAWSELPALRNRLLWMIAVSVIAWLLSIVLWPYAIQNPVTNVIASYKVMAHFPDTFRQIFDGRMEWSDFMPWYYLPKSMLITIPLLVTAGVTVFFIFTGRALKSKKAVYYFLILFAVVFPVIFVLAEKSNLYSSWRQFLFIYPPFVLLAASGFSYLIDYLGRFKFGVTAFCLIFFLLAIHPARFMLADHRYSYIYYNQLTGGLKGAYSNYETDYYFISQTEASGWLMNYLKEKGDTGKLKIKATYSVSWLFRNHPEWETSYFRYEERSTLDWDYAIVANRYITPYQLRNKLWPPKDAIHIIYADEVPVCAVLKRETKEDLKGYLALKEGRHSDAVSCFENAQKVNDGDEMIFYNYATALYESGLHEKADSALEKALLLNPDFEPALMYLGNIALAQGKKDEAAIAYQRVIKANRKYFEAYVALAQIIMADDVRRARDLLRECLTMSPKYAEAVSALAETYRASDPEIARKYDELAKSLER